MEEENEITYDNAFKFINPQQPVQQPPKAIKPAGGMGAISKQMVSTYRGENTGIGQSKYDEGIAWDADIDNANIKESLNEFRANQQSGLLQLGAGVARAGVKAAAEVAKLPGVIGGIVASPFVEEGQGYDTAFNNSWIKAIDKSTEWMNTELLPVYVNKAVKEGNLWDNITSTAFWATEGADGLGFMLGMMAPGAIINKLGIGAKLLSAGKNAAQLMKISGQTEAAVSALKGMGMTAKSMDVGIGAIVNTISESGAEAASTGNDMDARKGEILAGYTGPKMQELNALRMTGRIDETQYAQMSAKIAEDAEATFKEQRALAMRDVFKTNLGVLIIPNLLMSKALFGTAEKGIIKEVEKQGLKGVAQRVGKAATRYGEAFASEGFLEEASQSTAQKMFTDKAIRGELKRGDDSFGGALGGIKDFTVGEATNAYLDMVSSNEGQKAIFLGGIMGAPMMSATGRAEDVEGYKKFEQYKKDKNSILDGLHKNTNNFNTIFANDIYEKDDKGAFIYEKDIDGNNTNKRKINPVKAMEVAQALNNKEEQSKVLEKAIAEGDTETVERIKQDALFDMIAPAIYNGEAGMDALKEKLDEYNKADEIVAKRNNQKGEMTSSELAKNTMSMAKYLNEQNEKFKDYSSDVIRFDESIPPPIKSAFLNQLNQEYLRTKYNLRNDQAKLKTLEEKRKDILEEFGETIRQEVGEERKEGEVLRTSPLLQKLQPEIDALESSIKKGKKDIAEIWSDKGAEAIAKSLEKFTKTKTKQAETLSPENAESMQTLIESVRTVDNLKELAELAKSPLSQNNPTIEQELATRQIQLEQEEQARQEAEEAAKKAKAALAQQVEPTDGTENNPIDGLPIPLSGDTTSVQNTNDAETEEDGETEKDTTPKGEVVPVSEINNSKGARIVSTVMKTGEALYDNLKDFVNFERTPRKKNDDIVTFDSSELGASQNGRTAIKLIEQFKGGLVLRPEDIRFIEKYLPISVTLANGKDKATSFIDAIKEGDDKADYNANVEMHTMPLRRAIVAHLIANKGSFKDIRGAVSKQFPGQLKVEPRDEDGRIVKNSVLDLEVFNGMSEDKKIKYFQDNTSYVNFYGDLVSSLDPKKIIMKDAAKEGYIRGEVYLEIKRANGTPFQLKMNTAMISEAQSEVLFELMMFRFNDPSQGKDISLRKVLETIEPLNLNKEIELITKGLNIDEDVNIETLNSLIDLLIFNGNTNQHTQFGMYFTNQTLIGAGKVYTGRTGVQVGGLFDKISKEKTPLEGTPNEGKTFTAEYLEKNRETLKPIFMKFFQRKRHNILLTNPHFNFKDKAYVKYLIDNKIISTNAVAGKDVHQFQGYANVYLEPSITTKDGTSPEVVEVFGEPKDEKSEVPTADDHGLTSDTAAIANLETKLADPALSPLMKTMLSKQLDALKSKPGYKPDITPGKVEVKEEIKSGRPSRKDLLDSIRFVEHSDLDAYEEFWKADKYEKPNMDFKKMSAKNKHTYYIESPEFNTKEEAEKWVNDLYDKEESKVEVKEPVVERDENFVALLKAKTKTEVGEILKKIFEVTSDYEAANIANTFIPGIDVKFRDGDLSFVKPLIDKLESLSVKKTVEVKPTVKPTEVLETVNNTTVDKAFLDSLSDEQYDAVVKMFMVVKPNEIMTDELIIQIANDRKMTQKDLKKDCE